MADLACNANRKKGLAYFFATQVTLWGQTIRGYEIEGIQADLKYIAWPKN
jgi:hypothetical protein